MITVTFPLHMRERNRDHGSHGAGLASPDAVGAVLPYRIITFKILVTVAWVGYQYLHDRARGRIR